MTNEVTPYDGSEGLATLEPGGQPPETRMADAVDVQQRIQVFMNSEKRGRSQRRALVKGLVDGNPPYRNSDLRKAGRSQSCNVNWRVAEFYLNMARYAFYDVFSETPTYATIDARWGTPTEQQEWNGVMMEEFDALMRTDNTWDRENQFSQYDMVLYGCGPLIFSDELDWRNKFVPCANLLLPDFASSDPDQWEEAAIVRNYTPSELYLCIRNEDKARQRGWNIEQTKEAIMQAHQLWANGGVYKTWEWHQQQLKNNAYWYGSQCKVIQTTHYYFREFPNEGEDIGRITHTLVINPEDNQVRQGEKFLFRRIGRFSCWNEIVHPMYYDNDGGGYHHSVTGLGVKMFSAMEYQNRLICNLADKVFSPKILLKSLTSQADNAMNIVQWADFGRLPPGLDVVQNPINSYSEEGVMFNREITSLISSNLAQYRSALAKDTGNPITAYEASVRVSEQSKLGRTQLNHYYNQMDWLLQEKFNRVINPDYLGFHPGGQEAVKFREACRQRGVPAMAMKRAIVKATRTVGQGSQFARQQALQSLLAVSAMFPNEGGKVNLMRDYTAAVAGQSMVNRYIPEQETPESVDQAALATLQVAAAKEGIAPVVGGSQNHEIFVRVFMKAALDSLDAVKQTQDPQSFVQVGTVAIQFMNIIGPAISQHLEEMGKDPMRQNDIKQFMAQLRQLEQIKQQLERRIMSIQQQMRQQMAQAQAQQQKQNQVMGDMQLEQMKAQHDAQLKEFKAKTAADEKNQKAQQSMAIADAQAASDIQRKNAQATQDMRLKEQQAKLDASLATAE